MKPVKFNEFITEDKNKEVKKFKLLIITVLSCSS